MVASPPAGALINSKFRKNREYALSDTCFNRTESQILGAEDQNSQYMRIEPIYSFKLGDLPVNKQNMQ